MQKTTRMSIRAQDVEKVGGAVGYHLMNDDDRIVFKGKKIELSNQVYADVRAEKDVYRKLENVGRLMNIVENPRGVYGNLEGIAALYSAVFLTPEERAFEFGLGVFKEFIGKERRAVTEDVLAAQSLTIPAQPVIVQAPQYSDRELPLVKEEDDEIGLTEIEIDKIMARSGIRI